MTSRDLGNEKILRVNIAADEAVLAGVPQWDEQLLIDENNAFQLSPHGGHAFFERTDTSLETADGQCDGTLMCECENNG